jgi:hypothetical protein
MHALGVSTIDDGGRQWRRLRHRNEKIQKLAEVEELLKEEGKTTNSLYRVGAHIKKPHCMQPKQSVPIQYSNPQHVVQLR